MTASEEKHVRPIRSSAYRVQTRHLGFWGYSFFVVFWLILIDAAPAQLQMVVLGGSDPISASSLKLVLMAMLVIALPLRRSLDISQIPKMLWLVTACYLFLDFVNLVMTARDVKISGATTYLSYYTILMSAPLAMVFRGLLPERTVVRWLLYSFVVCGLLGFAQYFTKQPIVYTVSSDGHYKIMSWSFGGGVRAFSLFTSALMFGLFACLMGAVGVALVRLKGQLIGGVALFLFSTAVCYSTMTRNIYVVYCATILSAWIFTSKRHRRWTSWLPLPHAAIGTAVALGAHLIHFGGNSALTSSDTLEIRLESWAHYWFMFSHGSWWQQLFGLGYIQKSDSSTANAPIDSMFLALLLHVGIVGLVIFVAYLVGLWKWTRIVALTNPTPLSIAIASLWSTCLCVGVLNILPTMYGLIAMLIPIACMQQPKSARKKPAVSRDIASEWGDVPPIIA